MKSFRIAPVTLTVPVTGAAHPCKSPVTGTVNVTGAMRKDFTKHLLYVNVHTAKNPNGEIRGQIGS